MTSAELLTDAFGRIREVVHHTVEGLSVDDLTWQPGDEGNSIAWLVWHLTRIQDDHVAGVAHSDQVWTSAGWADRFGLPFPVGETGYGHRPEQVGAVVADSDSLIGYHDATHDRTVLFLRDVTEVDLDRIVDRRWDPPVTMGVRLVSVIADDLQHAGQAAYVGGTLLPRRGRSVRR
jgi:DinB superfamily